MKALDALVEGLFDHAGMFPPEALDFEAAMARAASLHTALGRPGMVASEMVVRHDDLARIDDETLAAAGFDRPCRVCVVGIHADEAPDVARQVAAFNEGRLATPPREAVSFEMHSGIESVEGAASALMPARYILAAAEVQVYWEPRFTDEEWNERLDDVFAVLDAANGESELPLVGLKVRCAGDTALTPATLARIVPEVTKRAIPFKATQGLHHPVAGVADNDVGFLGLAAALRLHAAGELAKDGLADCIGETDGDAFDFHDGLSWRGHKIDLGRLGQAMEQRFSIGSCSLREPDEGLALLWPEAAAAE